MVPENGSDGMVIPKAMESTAPREAPEETPRVDPSARAFFRRPCMEAPQTDSEAPVSATQITRGSRTVRIMEENVGASGGRVRFEAEEGRGFRVAAEWRGAA